jgi:hypothetical protein
MENYEVDDNVGTIEGGGGFDATFNKKGKLDAIKKIDVTEPAWVGDQITGHRTYHVICDIGQEHHKVIRRYSNFEALRNKLITQFPQCIIPVIPPKQYKEKIFSDDSEEVKERMRGLKRFLTMISEHVMLSTSMSFYEFMRNSEFATEASTPESSSLEEDTSTVSKYFYSLYETVVKKISGADSTLTFKNKNELDYKFDTDLQKLKNLLEFLMKLHENAKNLRELLSQENENCRNINSVIGNLQTSIRELDIDAAFSVDDEVNEIDNYEEEKKANFDNYEAKNKAASLKESVEMYESESKNENSVYELIVDMEEGIDILLASIDSIERRIKYKKAIETTKEDLVKLNNSTNEPGREKMLKEQRVHNLATDVGKIDNNLGDEIKNSIDVIERNTNKYISKLVNVRKSHLGVQKDQWKKIAVKYSAS